MAGFLEYLGKLVGSEVDLFGVRLVDLDKYQKREGVYHGSYQNKVSYNRHCVVIYSIVIHILVARVTASRKLATFLTST